VAGAVPVYLTREWEPVAALTSVLASALPVARIPEPGKGIFAQFAVLLLTPTTPL
jgi:hypothetical protein